MGISYSSPARRTIGILASLCEEVGLDPAEYVERLTDGFDRYGECNHLAPEFRLEPEWTPETQDVVCFPAVAVSRGEVQRDSLWLLIYMFAARLLVFAQRAMIAETKGRQTAAIAARYEAQQCRYECMHCEVPQVDCTVALPEQPA